MIDKLQLTSPQASLAVTGTTAGKAGAAELGKSFGEFLNHAMEQLQSQQQTVDALNEQMAAGELADVHQLMIASERAMLGLELTLQIRNKAIEAYQDIMRTQI